jgi:peptide/nickel transport system substrate-binding protein
VQLLRALQYATDRQQMVSTMMQGLTQVADTTVAPNAREYAEVESSIVRYPYDPQRAAQLIQDLGYTKGPDRIFYDASGTKLAVEARATSVSDIQPKALAAIADYWRQAGVAVDEVVIPNQRVQDLEYRATRPGFEVLSQSNDPEFFRGLRTSFHSAQIPLPQNRFAGGNRSRYSSPEMDARIEEYFATIPPGPRLEVLRQIVRLAGEQLPLMGLFYNPSFVLIGHRLHNVGGRGPSSTEGWNSEQWDRT